MTVPEQWHYSNYLEFIGERDGTLVDRDFVKKNFGSPEEYQKFVMDYVLPEKTQKELRNPQVQTLDRTLQTRMEKEDKALEEIGKKACLGKVSLSFRSTNKPE